MPIEEVHGGWPMSSAVLPHPQFEKEHRPTASKAVARSRDRRISDLDTLLRTCAVTSSAAITQDQSLIPQPGIYRALRCCFTIYGASALLSGLLYELWAYIR